MAERERIIELDRRHVWRPYTSTDDHMAVDPMVIVGARGAWLEDADGTQYLDANGSWWCNNLGHGHPRLLEALRRQSEQLAHCSLAGITHEPAALLARELAEVAPEGLARVFYSDDGSTAVEVALKMALQYWRQNGRPQRTRFVTLSGAYHGDTSGAMSVGGMDTFRKTYEPMLFEPVRAPAPEDGDAGWTRVAEEVEAILRREGDTIAGVVVEPLVQGVAGMRIHPPEVLRHLREATRRSDTFLLADEVFTGFGRTGAMWACDRAGVAPDLLCTAKGLSGGVLPFAATLASERVFDGFRGGKDRALMHGHTFCGNPLAATVAREVLAIYRDEDVLGQVRARAPRIARTFEHLGTLPGARNPRAIGMIGAVDLGTSGYLGRTGWAVYEAARRRGAYLRPLGDTVYICPALTIADGDLDRLLDIVEASVREVVAE
ncbi:MAG: adenosylmethionine--8-amino-7-oxononanoate transaminase [Myxococcota bacterium]